MLSRIYRIPPHPEGAFSAVRRCPCCEKYRSHDDAAPEAVTAEHTWRRALWLGSICGDCEAATKRTRPKPYPIHPKLGRYLRAIESGKVPPPFQVRVTIEPEPDYTGYQSTKPPKRDKCKHAAPGQYDLPLDLTPTGNVRKGKATPPPKPEPKPEPAEVPNGWACLVDIGNGGAVRLYRSTFCSSEAEAVERAEAYPGVIAVERIGAGIVWRRTVPRPMSEHAERIAAYMKKYNAGPVTPRSVAELGEAVPA